MNAVIQDGASPEIQRGLVNVYLDTTAISDIDGARGCLSYRGIKIEELAGNVAYLDVFHLLMVGCLPADMQRAAMDPYIREGEQLAADILKDFGNVEFDEPLGLFAAALSACGQLRAIRLQADQATEVWPASLRVLGLLGALIRHHAAATLDRPSERLRIRPFTVGILEALIRRAALPLECELFDLAFVTLAEHSLAASALAARIVASAEGNFAAALVAAMAAFGGRLHGGAVEDVAVMLGEIGSPDRAAAWVLARQRQRRPVPGFGHRIYRTRDPRADILAAAARRLAEAGATSNLLEIMDAVVEQMHAYRRHGIDLNVDAHTAILLMMLGVPRRYLTSLFALARISGWCAHIQEQINNNILIRPRLLYKGGVRRDGVQHG